MRQDNHFAKDDLQNSLHLKDKSRWLTGFYKLIAQIIWQNQTYNTEALMKKVLSLFYIFQVEFLLLKRVRWPLCT